MCTVDSFQGTEDLLLQALQFHRMGFCNKFVGGGGLVIIRTSCFSYRASFKYYIKDHQQMSLFFCNISLLYVSTLHVSGLYQPIIRGIPSCCYLLPLGSCGAWHMSACVDYIERPRRTRTYAKHHMNQVATSSNSWEYP